MVDWNEVQLSEFTIDLGYKLRDLTFETGRVGKGGRGDLDEHDIADPLRVGVQETSKGTKLRDEFE